MAENVKTGDRVRDPMSRLEGVVVARTEWLYGCVRVTFQPIGSKDGAPFDTVTVDEPQVEILTATEAELAEPRHGPRDDAAALRRD